MYSNVEYHAGCYDYGNELSIVINPYADNVEKMVSS